MRPAYVLLFVLLFTATTAHGESAYRVIEVTNGGKIAGTVQLLGELPILEAMTVTKDHDACGHAHPQETFLVSDKGRGLSNVVLLLTDIAAGKDFHAMPNLVIAQKECVYVPHVQVFKPGSKLTIRNDDALLHNIHAYTSEETVFNIAQPSYIKKWPIRNLNVDEVIDVRCDVHEWMHAYLVPSHTPYFAITDASGSFEIEQIPPGTYTLRTWHEALGTTEQKVTVIADKTVAVNLALDMATATIENDE